jgi:hypothetical protein
LETSFLNKFSSFTETEKIALKKKIFLFCFFLIISIILWLLISLSKQYDDQVNYPVRYKNFPESRVLIGDLPDHLRLDVNANGFTLLRFKLSSRYIPISFSVNSFKMNLLPGTDSSSFYIETKYAREYIASQLSSDFIIHKISPDTLIFRLSGVVSKKVPVIPAFKYHLEKQLILKKQILLDPDSVTASGPDFLIDTLSAIFTRTTDIGKIRKTDNEEVELEEIKFVYVKEATINVGFTIEQFTEKTVPVPVEILNLPSNKRMQAFPRYIQLTCQVGLSNFESLDGSMFRAQVDYQEIREVQSNKLKVMITKQPVFVQAVRFSPKTVEYIFEK